jgi:phenylacetate-CoA ligase
LYFSVIHLRPDWVHYYSDAIRKYSLIYLYGYASAVYQLAYHILQNGEKIELKAAITDAEPLYEYQRKVISEAFNCPVYDTYSLGEMVTAASVCEKRSRHLWPEAGIVEILDKDGSKITNSTSGRLVATGLLNDAMPLIRYDTLDIADPITNEQCGCGRTLPIIPALYGRKDDAIFTRDGRRIFLLDIIFEPQFHVEEGQIIQETLEDFRVRVVPTIGWSAKDEQGIISAMLKRLGPVHVIVEPVEKIERTWRGKLRVLISKVSNPDQQIT